MGDLVREIHQRHRRNVSVVSDISVNTEEPLQRDRDAEIRCILLCDSETEKNTVFETIYNSLSRNETMPSGISDCHILANHWEQPDAECLGKSCRFCQGKPITSDSDNSDKKVRHASNIEGFFRFKVEDKTFRLMLLSKDRQNLLKIYSYDFILVGVQVTNKNGCLDDSIWEFEWRRLDKHASKAVSPIVLLGYFRDILKIGKLPDNSAIDKTIEHAKENVKRAATKQQVIPRFCDFVSETDAPLCTLFTDLKKLYLTPGYVLQQCAKINNKAHFNKLINHPNITKEDVFEYTDGSVSGDNPIMIAAKLRHKELVSSVLRSHKFDTKDDNDFLDELVHMRNKEDQTLLAMIALQGPELEEQKLLILQKEIQIHCES